MLEELSSGNDHLIMAGEVATSPDQAFRYFVESGLLARWWAQAAEVDPHAGGEYLLSWPQIGRFLRGRYTVFQPGERLTFTWSWDQEPDLPERTVDVRFEPAGEGTRLTISHGPYGDSPVEQEDRTSHIEGWQYFIGRLAEAVRGS